MCVVSHTCNPINGIHVKWSHRDEKHSPEKIKRKLQLVDNYGSHGHAKLIKYLNPKKQLMKLNVNVWAGTI